MARKKLLDFISIVRDIDALSEVEQKELASKLLSILCPVKQQVCSFINIRPLFHIYYMRVIVDIQYRTYRLYLF